MSSQDKVQRSILPIPDAQHVGVTTYDAKDPDTKFPPIEPLRPPKGAPNVLIVLIDDVRLWRVERLRRARSTRRPPSAWPRTGSSSIASTPPRCARRRGRRC